MALGWHCPTLTMYGLDGFGPWLRSRGETSVTVLTDPAVTGAPIAERIRGTLARHGRTVHTVEAGGPDDTGGVEALGELARQLAGSGLVVAVGGGALLDRAKLAGWLCTGPQAAKRLAVPQRSGLVLLPPRGEGPRPALVAVPTTLGTGSELSSVACLDHPRGKRLVMGTTLQPDAAVVDPLATSTLPYAAVAEGALEVLFRLAGLYVGDLADLPTEDALVETLAVRTVQLGEEVRAAHERSRAVDDTVRAELAKVSGLAHAGWTVLGREPYANRGWYVANELSSALGLRKMTAVAALLPPLWRRVADGDERYGSARRLGRLWQRLRTAVPEGLPADAADGIAHLADRWHIGRTVTAPAGTAAGVAARAVRAWGAGLPMLGRLTADDLTGLLAGAVHEERQERQEHEEPARTGTVHTARAGAARTEAAHGPAAHAQRRPQTSAAGPPVPGGGCQEKELVTGRGR